MPATMPSPSSGEPAVEVVVAVRGTVAEGAAALRSIEAQAGVPLEPMHPGVSDAELGRFAIARVAPSAVELVVERLRRCAEVDAAYVKPGDALP